MGFIKAFTGAISGTFADQWQEFMKPDFDGMSNPGTVAIYPAVKVVGGQNTKGHDNIITNGTKIIVPPETALITMVDGAITGCICEAGGFIYSSDDPNAASIFSGDGIWKSFVTSSWDKIKHGNVAAAQHNAFYVNMKPIAGNKFGTPGTIYWDDAFLQTQVGASLRGTYMLQIVNPITFISYVPNNFLMNGEIFDFADSSNTYSDQLFEEVVGALNPALSAYTNDPTKGNRITSIQKDSAGFAASLSQEVERLYQWESARGIKITSVAIESIDYDEESKAILAQAKQDDVNLRNEMRRGQAFANNMPGMMAAASASAMNTAAGNENGAMMGFMGMGFAQQQGGGMLNTVAQMPQQPVQPVQGGMMPPVPPVQQPVQQPVQPVQPVAPVAEAQPAPVAEAPVQEAAPQQPAAAPQEDPYQKLAEMKKLLDAGVISQEDFDAAKKNLLGI